MGTNVLTSLAEYLKTPFESPEPDFIDGELVTRSMPNLLHSRAVAALIIAFFRLAPKSLLLLPELRLRVLAERYRVADLAIFDQEPQELIPEKLPLIVIEVLSPDESHAELMSKFADYSGIHIPHIWLVDPITKGFSIYREGSLISSQRLELPEYSVVIELSDIFSNLFQLGPASLSSVPQAKCGPK